ncbi:MULTISPECIES: iron ABC transporter substrate-binding protein [Glaesserella]|uniref:Iron ABC transporter substrate-binding protein n=1 Tax=Glaesserella australis TaxID=2094024 RepID=A0A328BW08_9PAST|nr:MULTISPECIES: iron ABC transporter substrate-binding protein [Glaesserella]AUI66001.1 iron ABC transporter substrate-binding protein [Glaesserella sp. 15-184]RAL18279.1 iron ABC transporter substrate-binding protein [Glaesserella australis]
MKKWLLPLATLLFASSLSNAAENPISVHFGELPKPETVQKIISAGNPSDVVLLAVAPEKLAGFAGFKMQSAAGKLFPPALQQLETLGRVSGKNSTLSPEKIVALAPSLIVDVGNVSPNYLDQAKKTQAHTQVPYVLLDGALTRTPELLRELGKLVGNSEQAEPLAKYAENVLAQAVGNTQNFAKTVYLARGADGLETGFAGSIHTEAMELVGLKNVATGDHKGLAKVSMEQLLQWNPDIIFTQFPEFYQSVWDNPQWQALNAVKNKQVYLVSNKPFGWLDSPPSLNRLLGMEWLQHHLAGKKADEFVPQVKAFYKLFYQIELSDEQAKELMPQSKN